MAHLEPNNIISPKQSGYRKHRSTEDQLTLLAQEIENAFQEKKKDCVSILRPIQGFLHSMERRITP